ncbi:MAG: putative Ig domain-containing protein, partial [Paludibacteraceae bacterium]|nr:putative Ig domain-containing protein [Paludibacteraceae bacterium]
MLSKCDVVVTCPDYSTSPTVYNLSSGCSIAANTILSALPSPTQSGGNNLEVIYWFKEDNGKEQKVESTTVFSAGHTYSVRGEVYVDDIFMSVCEVPDFTITANYTATIGKLQGEGSVYMTVEGDSKKYESSVTVPCGKKVTYHAVPGDCSKFKVWHYYYNGSFWNGSLSDAPQDYTVEVTENVHYQVEFENGQFTVTAATSTDAECDGTGSVKMFFNNAEVFSPFTPGWCSDVVLVAEPTDCSKFDHWELDGEKFSENLRVSIRKESTWEACFKAADISSVEITANDEALKEQTICLGESIQEVTLKTNVGTMGYSTVGHTEGLTAVVTRNPDDDALAIASCDQYGVNIFSHSQYDWGLMYYVHPEILRDQYDFSSGIAVYDIKIYDGDGDDAALVASTSQNHGSDQGNFVPGKGYLCQLSQQLDFTKEYTIKIYIHELNVPLDEVKPLVCSSNFSKENGYTSSTSSDGKKYFQLSGTPQYAGDVTYTVASIAGAGCASNSVDVIIHVNDTIVPVLSSDDAVCKNADLVINETVGNATDYTYEWSVEGGTIAGGQGTAQLTANWPTAGTKKVSLVITNKTTGCQSRISKNITVNDLPTVAIPAIAAVCPNVGTVDVTATVENSPSDYNYVWGGDVTYDKKELNEATVRFTAPDDCGLTRNINVKVTDGNGCESALATQTISVKNPVTPTIETSLTNRDFGCDISTKVDPAVADFTVTDECGTTKQVTLTPSAVTDLANCGKSQTWTATYTNVCGTPAESKSVTYTWKEATAPTIAAIADVQATAMGGCKYKMPDLSSVTLAATTDGCGATPTFVSQSVAVDEVYDQTSENQTIPVSVTVKGSCDLTQTATVNVIIPANTLTLTMPTARTICKGNSVELVATTTSATTFSWAPAAGLNKTNEASVIAAPTATTTYTLTVSDANGCSTSGDVTVTVNPLVELSATNLEQTVCANTAIAPVVITSANATVATSTLPAGLSFADGKIIGTPTAAGTYTITITATSNQTPACDPQTKTFSLKVNPLVELSATNLEQTVCAN